MPESTRFFLTETQSGSKIAEEKLKEGEGARMFDGNASKDFREDSARIHPAHSPLSSDRGIFGLSKGCHLYPSNAVDLIFLSIPLIGLGYKGGLIWY